MAIDLNQHDKQNEPIPTGTQAMIHMIIEPGTGAKRSEMSPALTHGNDDIHYMHTKLEVMTGPNAGRKFDQNFTVAGGKTDERGRSKAGTISGRTIRAMWEAHKGINPSDMTQAAVQGRMINDYADLHDIYFPAVIAIRAGSNGYPPKNEIHRIITPDKEEYNKIRNGEVLEPLPIGIIGEDKKAAKPASTQPVWAQPGAQAAPASTPPANGTAAAPAPPMPPSTTGTAGTAGPISRPAWAQ